MHGQRVFALPEERTHSKLVGEHHIFTFADESIVEIILGNAIHALKHQVGILFFFGRCEGAGIPPFVALVLFGLQNVFTHIQICRELACLGKIHLHTAGNGCRQAQLLRRSVLLGLAPQLPNAV